MDKQELLKLYNLELEELVSKAEKITKENFSNLERQCLSGYKGHTEHQMDRTRKQYFQLQLICISMF